MHLAWPGSVPVPYAEVAPHCVQAASPALEKEPAAHEEQAVLFVAEQAEDGKAPAAHEAQAVQGDMPEALKVEPAKQEAVTQAEKGETEPTAPAWPAVHSMPVHESCMALDHVPAGQSAEATPPAQKLPGAQGSAGSVSVLPTSAQA